MNKKIYHHGDLKNELIRVGARVLNEQGIENFSLRKVAKKIGVSHTAPYRHFKTKEDLLANIVGTAIDIFEEELVNAYREYENNPKEQLVQIGKAYVRVFRENTDLMKVIFWGNLKNKVDLAKIVHNSNNRECNSVLEKSVENCIATGKTKIKDKMMIMLLSWSCVQGLSSLIVDELIEVEEEMIDKSIRLQVESFFKDI